MRGLSVQAQVARRLVSACRDEICGDEELLTSAVEGGSDLMEAIDGALAREAELAAYIEALKQQQRDLRDRKDRFEAQRDRIRAELRSAMTSVGLRRVERASGTMWVSPGQQRMEITDRAAVPYRYWRMDWDIDTRSLARDLSIDGEVVPGARMVDGYPTINIRRK